MRIHKIKKVVALIVALSCIFAMNMNVSAMGGDYTFWYDTESVIVTVNGNEAYSDETYYFEDDEYVVEISQKDGGAAVRGCLVIVGDEVAYLKTEEGYSGFSFTFEDLSQSYFIEVLTEDDYYMFPNDMVIYYDEEDGTVYVNGKAVPTEKTIAFEPGAVEFKFDYSAGNGIPYAVGVYSELNDEYQWVDVFSSNTVTLTIEDGDILYVDVFWTETEYDYYMYEYDYESATEIEIRADGPGDVSVSKEQKGCMEVLEYKNLTKIVYDWTTESIDVELLMEDDVAVTALFLDGEPYSLEHLNGNILTLDSEILSSIWEVNIVFEEVESPLEEGVGDVNFDGTVDTTDAQAIFNHFMGLAELSEEALALADVSGDGSVDTTDAQAAFNYFMGI